VVVIDTAGGDVLECSGLVGVYVGFDGLEDLRM
jgi:hypothetical protein